MAASPYDITPTKSNGNQPKGSGTSPGRGERTDKSGSHTPPSR